MQKSDIDFKKLPDAPGVYLFRDTQGEVVYVGKATSLRDRVRSYFAGDIAEVRSPLIAKIIADSKQVTTEETDSVLEALILEAKHIKRYQPIGNTDNKDNKSWNYVVITNEEYPRVLVVRERELSSKFGFSGSSLKTKHQQLKTIFGPFPSAGTLREALKIIRKIFPFFDTKFSIAESMTASQEKTIRFNQSIGLYPKSFDTREYAKNIRALVDIFSNRKITLIKRLEREMKAHAKKQEFEKADVLKRKIFALQHIQDITLIKEDLKTPNTAEFRIEAYDTAHMRGAAARGVMAVVLNGEAVPSEYRLFTIQDATLGDDYAALDEIITRRAKHLEWPFPQLVVIDGGKGHLTRAKKTLRNIGINADVVSVVKDEKHKPREILGSPKYAITHEQNILLANAEAHRFAISKHRRALRKRL